MSDRSCIYIAANRTEAQHVEEVLTRSGSDYAVEVAPYAPRVLRLFPTYQGATFYVSAGQAPACREALHKAGLTKGLVEED